jgi:hypothetical protein
MISPRLNDLAKETSLSAAFLYTPNTSCLSKIRTERLTMPAGLLYLAVINAFQQAGISNVQ